MYIPTDTMLFCLIVMTSQVVYVTNVDVSITVFSPKLPQTRLFALDKVKTAVEIALEKIKAKHVHNFNIEYINSNESDVDSPVAAFKVMNKGVHLFIGPVYDYAVSPVARYAPKWNVPVISPGAFAYMFKQKRSYQTLTRIHTAFNSMNAFLSKIFFHFKWRKIKMVGERFGRNDIYVDFCELAIESIHTMFANDKKKYFKDFERYEILREPKALMTEHVLEKVGKKFAGKSFDMCD